MPYLPNAGEVAAVEAVLTPNVTYYLSLNTGPPGQNGANEAAVTRQPIVFTLSGQVLVSNANIVFTDVPAASSGYPYLSIWSALTGGTYEGGGATIGLSGSIAGGANLGFTAGQVQAQVA